MTSFVQAPFTGNYNAQSGEIVGVLKNMNDTFTANLANARQVEAKALADFTAMKKVLDEEYDEASDLFEKRKKEIGETAELISTTTSERDTADTRLADDQEFLASLTDRCAKKKAEFEKRNMLRSQEEAAIAEAIAVLNSDAAFATFGKVSATSTGATGFIQISKSQNEDAQKVRATAAAALARSSKELHSVRLAKIAMELSSKSKATNPFVKVLENINGTVDLIDAEEADDSQKLATCNKEQDINNKKRDDKKADLGNRGVVGREPGGPEGSDGCTQRGERGLQDEPEKPRGRGEDLGEGDQGAGEVLQVLALPQRREDVQGSGRERLWRRQPAANHPWLLGSGQDRFGAPGGVLRGAGVRRLQLRRLVEVVACAGV